AAHWRRLPRLSLGRRDGHRDRRYRGRALHRVLHRRLSRTGPARAREGFARERTRESVSLTYRDAGVNIARAEDALSKVKERIARTRRPEVIGEVGQFGGLFASPGADKVLVATTDGVGTKLEIARLLDRHEVVGADLVHHCVNDALAMGAEPLFFLDYFATSKIDPNLFSRVVGAMLGGSLLTAHRPYLGEFRALRQVADIHSIAHLTGGGWEGNLPRSLPNGTAASIDRASWEVPALFTLLARLGDLEEMEQFDTWNMGIGLVVAISADAVGAALDAVPGAVALGAVVPHSSGRRVIFG